MPTSLTPVLLTIGVMLLAFAALHDIGFRTVPNRVPLMLLLLGAMLRFQQNDFITALLCGLLMFAVTYVLWRFGWIGGADAKLLSASAMFIPPSVLPTMMIATSLSGGILALVYLLGGALVPRGTISPLPKRNLLMRVRQCELRRLRRRGPLPYAAAIATGSWFAIAGS